MRLRLTDPARVLIDREVTYVQAEDATGRFGVLPRHEPYLTALESSVLVFRYKEGGREQESYVAVRNGVLRVAKESVEVAVRGAHLSDDLAELQGKIKTMRTADATRSYRSSRSMYQMQIAAWRRLMEFENVSP